MERKGRKKAGQVAIRVARRAAASGLLLILFGNVTLNEMEAGAQTITSKSIQMAKAGTVAVPLEFEVASVRRSDPNANNQVGFLAYPGGRVVAGFCTLLMLIAEAFEVQDFQVAGGPKWISEERFDIVAKPPSSAHSSSNNPSNPKLPLDDEQRQMLQALLADRFGLRYHEITGLGPVFFLEAKNKTKLQGTHDPNAYPWFGGISGGAVNGDGIAAINISMALLAARLARYAGRPVLDKTGLDSSYDFKCEYEVDSGERDAMSVINYCLPSVGLKLRPSQGPIREIIIDQANQPSAN